jgi:hypothetical protein
MASPVIPKLQPAEIEQMELAAVSIEEILLQRAHYPATERALVKLQRALVLELQNLAEKPPRRR